MQKPRFSIHSPDSSKSGRFSWITIRCETHAQDGYARVSTNSQNLDRQIAALRAEGCAEIFREKASGKDTKGRPRLEKAIDALGTGDVLIVAEWDRATRSMIDGIAIIDRVAMRGCFLKVLDRGYLDLTTSIGRDLMALFSAMAEDERKRIVERAREGLDAAKARGAKFGRKPKLTEHQKREALLRLDAGETARALGRSYDVHHATIARLRP